MNLYLAPHELPPADSDFVTGRYRGDRSFSYGEPSLANSWHLTIGELVVMFAHTVLTGYIFQAAYSSGIPFRVVTHPIDTRTVDEKRLALGPTYEGDVAKTIVLTDGSHLYVIVTKGNDRIDRKTLASLLDMSKREAKGLYYASPSDLAELDFQNGTASPLIERRMFYGNGGPVKVVVFDDGLCQESSLHDYPLLDTRTSFQINTQRLLCILSEVLPPNSLIRANVI
ncbi:MAG: hypothetical protein J4428_00025 [Candidatus Aenigmarchaeota archaeon]|nr:hypothetical protein [Candidatus Aenigmarchaeota archaeon]